MRAAPRLLLIGGGFLAVFLFSSIDREATATCAVPLWAYATAHMAILAGLFKRGAVRRLVPALLIFAMTFTMTSWGLSSLGHRLNRVKPGMDVAEVRRVMAGFTEGTGTIDPFTNREFVPAGRLVFRDPRHTADNMAWGTVNFRGGRATDVFISPD